MCDGCVKLIAAYLVLVLAFGTLIYFQIIS
jgi:hypothetical protein